MTGALAHRGPDAEGVFAGEGVALGHRRLSILDLTSTGDQPMSLQEAGMTLVFNGEAYNFQELKLELEERGERFRGHSDTEVILRAYANWDLAGLRRLEGIFALALWDSIRQRLVLMRDRFGVKPLFYTHSGHRLMFGSEIKAVLIAGDVDDGVDEQAFSEYLWYGNAYEDRTIYRAVRSLLPGHWLIREAGRDRLEPWWQVEEWLQASQSPRTQRDAEEAVRESLDAAVKRQLVADVPVGIFLSGGIDSSAIAAAAMHVQSMPLASYSVGFDFDRGVNELPKARRVAKHLGLDHHEIQVSGSEIENVLMSLSRAHDEPFADAANIPLYLLAQQLGGSIKVVLQGDGGDEMFAGYRRYSILSRSSFWRHLPRGISSAVRAVAGKRPSRLSRILEAAGAKDPALRMALLLTTETLDQPPTALLLRDARQSLEQSTDPFLAYRRCARRFREADPVQQMMLTDMQLQLPSQFLSKVDRATMACGIEVRVPFLDELVVRLAITLPTEWKVRGRERKIVLRNAMRGRVPGDILDGPKTGFSVPYQFWLRSKLHNFARAAVLEPRFIDRFGFDRRKLERILSEHREQRCDHGFRLWKVFQLALWSNTRD